MKKYGSTLLLALLISTGISAQELSPYILVGDTPNTLAETEQKVNEALKSAGFEIIKP